MTGKIRMMSAGMGGASRYRVNPWGNQGGGNKKQGLPPTTKRKKRKTKGIKRKN